jgi:hypothetical protein
MRISSVIPAIALGALALAGVLKITSGQGPGLDPDSMSYMHAASTLVEGHGLRDINRDWWSADSTMPLAHWPPGYPVAIATAERAGLGAAQGARLISALAALVTIATIVWLVADFAGTGAGVIAGLLVMVTPAVVQVHESVLSEPLFIALLSLTLAAMVRAVDKPIVSGVLAGVASIVRYAGLSLVGGVVLWQFARAGTIRQRITRAAIAALPAIVIQGAWVLRTMHSAGKGSIRQISIYGQLLPTLHEGWSTISAWLVPGMGELLGIFVALGVVALIAFAIWESRPLRARMSAGVAAALLTVCYLSLVLAARLVADASIPLDDRIMAPLFVLLEVAVVVTVAPAWRQWPAAGKALVAVLVAMWWGAAIRVSVDSARYAMETGNDFAEDCWSASPLAAWVRANGAGHALYTNGTEALYFHAKRLSRELPDEVDPATVRALADTLARRHALVAQFDESCGALNASDSVIARLPLREIASMPTGRVLEIIPDSLRVAAVGARPATVADTLRR